MEEAEAATGQGQGQGQGQGTSTSTDSSHEVERDGDDTTPWPRRAYRVGCDLGASDSDETETTKWVDVTAYVNVCAGRHLDVRDPMLCNPHSFSLHDSMAALELMDPAMDCCELPLTTTRTESEAKSQSKSGPQTDDANEKKPAPIVSDDDDDDDDADVGDNKASATVRRHRPPRGLDDPTCPPPLPWDDDLTISDVRAVACQTLVRFRAVLDGAGVAEGTYTCLYAHDAVLDDMRARLDPWIGEPSRGDVVPPPPHPSDLGEAGPSVAARLSLLALSLALVKLSETARSIVQHGDIYEEEDFTPASPGFSFYPSADVAHVGVAVRAALAALAPLCDDDGEGGDDDGVDGGGRGGSEGGGGGGGDAEAEAEATQARDAAMLRHILTFELNFLEACVALATLEPGAVETSVELARTLLLEGEDHLQELAKVLPTLEPKDDDSGGEGATGIKEARERERRVLEASFDSHVNRRLLGNTPVRKVRYRPVADAVGSLGDVSAELRFAVCDLARRGETYRRILTILRRVSAARCNVLTRSLVVLNLYFDDKLLGRHELPLAVAGTLVADGVPAEVVDSEYGGVFVHRLGKPLYDCLKMLALSRSRQRSFVDAFMLAEWGDLQREANTVDYHYRTVVAAAASAAPAGGGPASGGAADDRALAATPAPAAATEATPYVTNWVILHTVWIMEHYLGLSVELGLCHEPHDLAAAYWYLSFLHSARLNVWTVMRATKKREEVKRRVIAATAASGQEVGRNVGGDGKAEAAAASAEAADGNVGKEQHVPKEGKSRKKKGKNHGKKSSANGNANARDRAANRPHAPSPPSPTGEQPPQPDIISSAEVEENISYMLLGIRRSICSGLFQFIMALYQAQFLRPPPEYRFTSRRRQFEKRFEAFHSIPQPPPLTYDDLEKGSDFSGMAQQNLLASATESFKSAKALLDRVSTLLEQVSPAVYPPIQKKEVTELTKICVGNSLFLHKLSQMVKPGSNADAEPKVVFDFNVDRNYCTIKIT